MIKEMPRTYKILIKFRNIGQPKFLLTLETPLIKDKNKITIFIIITLSQLNNNKSNNKTNIKSIIETIQISNFNIKIHLKKENYHSLNN